MLNCVDLFAGAGGFSLAARDAGLRVRLAIENNRYAVETYRENFCKNRKDPPRLASGDIAAMAPGDVRFKTFASHEICDLMLGGPPCQGFSAHRLNDAGVADRRNDLIHVYFSFVRAFDPSVFLMENVPGMLWPRHAAALDRFYLEGAMAGYDLFDPIVVDARDYGVPQRRKRVFILGLRRGVTLDKTWPPSPTHGSSAARRTSPELAPWVDCAQAFRLASPGDPNDVHMTHVADLVDAFRRTPVNGGSRAQSGRVLPCHAGHDGHKDVYGRIDPREPAPTMTTACINPSKGRFVHPTLDHGITARQAARIQTFPDEHIFLGGLMAAGQQIGNAVPVELGKVLIDQLLPTLTAARRFRSADAPVEQPVERRSSIPA